jgi:hypothetical protein
MGGPAVGDLKASLACNLLVSARVPHHRHCRLGGRVGVRYGGGDNSDHLGAVTAAVWIRE